MLGYRCERPEPVPLLSNNLSAGQCFYLGKTPIFKLGRNLLLQNEVLSPIKKWSQIKLRTSSFFFQGQTPIFAGLVYDTEKPTTREQTNSMCHYVVPILVVVACLHRCHTTQKLGEMFFFGMYQHLSHCAQCKRQWWRMACRRNEQTSDDDDVTMNQAATSTLAFIAPWNIVNCINEELSKAINMTICS